VIKYLSLLALLTAALLSGCAQTSPVGLVDVSRIVQNWSQYQGYQAQLQLQEQTIFQKSESSAQKQRDLAQLQAQYNRISQQLINEVQSATARVARQRNLQLVLTRQGVGYGGVDITRDVEKLLNITEAATPSPNT
jgi:Skp family chaperone for outer membrane proteins